MPKAIKEEEWPYYDTKWSWMVCFTKQADACVCAAWAIGSLPKPMRSLVTNENRLDMINFCVGALLASGV
jgi:hypothetical protein